MVDGVFGWWFWWDGDGLDIFGGGVVVMVTGLFYWDLVGWMGSGGAKFIIFRDCGDGGLGIPLQ